jgi:hypothetical protein
VKYGSRSARVVSVLGAWALLPSLAFAGPPFRTDDPEPVDFQHYEITLFSQGTQTNHGWSGLLPGFEVNYGVLPNVQLHAIILQGFTSPDAGRTGFALGDVELGVKYRLINPAEQDWYPQIAIFPAVELPTGNQKLGLSTRHEQFFLPVWLQQDFDPWTVYGGGGYWINPGSGNRNYGFVGAALWRKVTDKLALGAEVFHQGSPAAGVPDSTGFNIGVAYDFSDHWHLLASAGRGLRNTAQTNLFSYYMALQLTF